MMNPFLTFLEFCHRQIHFYTSCFLINRQGFKAGHKLKENISTEFKQEFPLCPGLKAWQNFRSCNDFVGNKNITSYFSEYTSSSFLLQGQETTKGGLSPTHNTHTPRVADTVILTNFLLAIHF